MIQQYKISGMTCAGCQKKISEKLNSIDGLQADINLEDQTAIISSETPIVLSDLNKILESLGKYKLEDSNCVIPNVVRPQDRISPSSVYYCPMECEGDKVYFKQGCRCPDCNMFLVPIEEKLAQDPNYKPKYSSTMLPENFKDNLGKYYCPMFCEGDHIYKDKIDCPVCNMHLEEITERLIENAQFYHPTPTVEKPAVTSDMAGKYYCPMYCEGDKTYDTNVGCPVCGMDLVKYPSNNDVDGEDESFTHLKKKFVVALLFTLPVFVLSMGRMFFKFSFSHQTQGFIELLLSLPVLFFAGWFIMKRGWISFKTWNLNMFSLIALGVFAAFSFSIIALLFPSSIPTELRSHHQEVPLYFEAVCVIITLVILGQLMEAIAHKKTGNAIKELIKLSPSEAHLMSESNEKNVPLSEIKIGDLLKVKAGEKVPVDGKIVEGHAIIDESMITGEPIPDEKNTGDQITAGTVNGNFVFIMKAEKVGDQTLLSKIIKMVNDASRSRAPIQKLTDKVAKIFVPTVVLVSIITFILWHFFGPEGKKSLFAFVNAVAVLIVACPCALGLATPMSLMVGIGKGAKNGILIKNAEALELMNKVNVVITDKTGTLTEGKPTIEHIESTENYSKSDVLKLAFSLNQNSNHPLSTAVIKKATEENITSDPIVDFQNIIGKGIRGSINGKIILLGNAALLKSNQISISEKLRLAAEKCQENAQTVSFVSQDGEVIGFLSFKDKLKESSKKAITLLLDNGIDVIMMTGDNLTTAKAVAHELGLKNYMADCLPEDKLDAVKKHQLDGKIVAMTGDGINDSPALAQADIGIAMGTGTDVAIETAEITLLKGDLLGVYQSKLLSKKLLKNIKENLFFAFIYNIIGIPIAAGLLYPFFGILLSPMIAAAAMSFSSLSVIINSLRLNAVDLKV